MKAEIENAVAIAESYRNSHDGEIPVLVIAHGANGEQNVYVGNFRPHKNHIGQDQVMFCSVMRSAFAINGVERYEFLVKPEFNYIQAQMTKNVLAVVAVSKDGKSVEWFEIEDEALVPYFSEMPVEGLFSRLLPTDAERAKEFTGKEIDGIRSYLKYCTFVPPTTSNESNAEDAFASLLEAFQ